LVHAIGDASEITQNSTDKKLRMVEKETDCRLKYLQVNVERLKSILLTSDLVNINETVADTEALSTKIAELNAIKKQMEKKLACGDSETDEISCEPSNSNDSINARKSLRERISKLRDSIKTDKHKVSDINVE